MTLRLHSFVLLCSLRVAAAVLLAGPVSGGAAEPVPEARALMDQALAAQRSAGFSARGRMVISRPPQPDRTLQFLVKGRHTEKGKDFLYLALYPAADKGRAVVVRRDPAGAVTGFLREPDGKTANLNAAGLNQPLFGSDLSLADLNADFWTWPAPVITGQETVCRRECRVIETRAPKNSEAAGSMVKLWISPETALPLRMEMYSTAGRLTRRTECRNVVKSGGHYTMEKLTIESPATGQQTLLDFSRGSRDIEVPAQDFTPEGIALMLKD